MIKKIVDFIFESFHLKLIKHEGVRLAGIQHPDSIAEHSLNAAQIGYVLAKMEGADAHRVASMLIRHDLAEVRIGDVHKVGARYHTEKNDLERKAFKDQTEGLEFGDDVYSLFLEYEERSTLEGKIAKDADYLEQAFQAKIYVENGYTAMQDRIDNVGNALQTESAKQVWTEMTTSSFTDRRKKTGLKNLSRN